LLPGAFVRSEHFHRALVLLILGLVLVFITRFTLRLG
jgi:hypothetical protein